MTLEEYLHELELEIELVVRKFIGLRAPTRRDRMRRVEEVKYLIKEVQGIIPVESAKLIKVEYNVGARHALNKVPDLGLFKPDESNFSLINRETVNTLAQNLKGDLHGATATIGRRSQDALRKHALQQTTKNVLHNLPSAYEALQLEKKLVDSGTTGFVDSRGRKWKLSTYSDMAIRTSTSEARNQAVANSVLSRGLDLVRVDEHKHPNDVCSPFDGKVFSLTGRSPGYPVMKKPPPFHPNCEHNILPARENFTDIWAVKQRENEEERQAA